MLALTTKLPQFNQFLLDNLGIERNDFTVEEARAAAKHGGDGWKDCCTPPRDLPTYLPTRHGRRRANLPTYFLPMGV